MCTAATYKTRDFYFGRTLDYEFSYGDQITITPRNYPFHFRHAGVIDTHFAIIGMAHVAENYPLYYDAINEKGLGMAGLNFVGNAAYADVKPGLDNIAQFEFIPWILSQCASVAEVRTLLARMNLVNTPFSKQFPLAQLHWIISDKEESITVESMSDGLHIYDNPVGVLTNNPPFPQQMFQLTTTCICRQNSLPILLLTIWHFPPTAAAWGHSDFRATFLLLPALSESPLPE